MITYRHDLSKTYNKSIIFIYKNNSKLIFLSNIDIELSDLGYYTKIQIFIFMLKEGKANLKKLVRSSNSTKDV